MPSARSPFEAKHVTLERLVRGRPQEEQWLDSSPYGWTRANDGHLDTLHFVPFQMPSCEPRQVLIEVKAAGMNDVQGACPLPRRGTRCAHLRR